MYINKMFKISFLVFLLIMFRTIAFLAFTTKPCLLSLSKIAVFCYIIAGFLQLSLKREGIERNF